VHGGHRLALRGQARPVPRGGPHQLRAEPGRERPHRTVVVGAPGRIPPRVGIGTLARGRPLAEGHAGEGHHAAGDDRGPARAPGSGHVDERRPRGARRLGEQAPAHDRVVATVLVVWSRARIYVSVLPSCLRDAASGVPLMSPILPPRSGFSALKMPHELCHASAVHACIIHRLRSATFLPPRAEHSASVVLSAPITTPPFMHKPPFLSCLCHGSFGPAKPSGGLLGSPRTE